MDVKQIVLSNRPKGLPSKDDFRTEKITLPQLKNDEVLIKAKYFSVDPYMRGRMNDAKSYTPPYKIEEPIVGGGIGKVLESKSNHFKKDEIVQGHFPWATEFIAKAENLQKINTALAPAPYYLGILGMPGLTAYFGLIHIGKPKEGETVVISGAAGAVGIVVGQIAKLKGCRVVGIAGSDEKINMLMNEFQFDEAINYKTTSDMKKAIGVACPNGVDIYFDNVGGSISDAVISHINFHARIVLCGQISLYNSTEVPTGPRLQPMLLTRSALMQGFIVGNFKDRFREGIEQLSQWVKDGKLKYKETTIEGFDKLPEAFLGLFSGENKGKMVVKV
ncbi:MAG TPA: NADP-dependent oxidoreductase [Hanamia sp.]|nr:NADP-dependent oxidoreductase [Hanamia sp.]